MMSLSLITPTSGTKYIFIQPKSFTSVRHHQLRRLQRTTELQKYKHFNFPILLFPIFMSIEYNDRLKFDHNATIYQSETVENNISKIKI